jgi:7-keto-8-aminopelargonate synthetase-like enzyme
MQLTGLNHVQWRGRRLVYFSGCDYFRLANHALVRRAVRAGLKRFGLSTSASRLTTGHHRLYDELEAELARFFKAESALAVSNGYCTNTVVAQALREEFTKVLIDERAHGALADAARHFDCPVVPFAHRDVQALSAAAKRAGKRARLIVLTDGLFAHDGSVAPLDEYLRVLPGSATLLVDDAHGAGVLGERGRGTLEHCRIGSERVIQCVSLSKAFGTYGGAVLGPASLRRKVLERSPVFMGSTPLLLPLVSAAITTLRLLRRESAWRGRLQKNANWLKSALRNSGFAVPHHPGPIVALHPASESEAKAMQRTLLVAGIYPPFLRYGAAQQGFFRFVISSEHTPTQLRKVVAALRPFAKVRT